MPGRPFEPGRSGNPAGRPRGARNSVTLAIEALLDGEAETLTRKAVEMALGGDMVAMRLCLERLAPARRDRPVTFDLPPLQSAADVARAGRDLMRHVAEGEMTPTEAGDVMRLLEGLAKTIEVAEFDERLRALEGGRQQ